MNKSAPGKTIWTTPVPKGNLESLRDPTAPCVPGSGRSGYWNPAFCEDIFDSASVVQVTAAGENAKTHRKRRKRKNRQPANNRILTLSRSCTDIICGFVFTIFLITWGLLAFFGKKIFTVLHFVGISFVSNKISVPYSRVKQEKITNRRPKNRRNSSLLYIPPLYISLRPR